MSQHSDLDMPSRETLVAATSTPMPRWVTLVSGSFAIIGVIVFIVGAIGGNDRVWHALHFNWLFFASVSQAGVVMVAVQRITTARWSRPIVRLLEGYVAFLPAAFLLLIL
ncbi:MAG: hypothetical protein ACREOJ_01100, partial [Gemmatimonadaceae bacterium]